ncbi:MAG: hypothetical protein WC527_00945 [Candidatus Margulisiibacteriota bacterium]
MTYKQSVETENRGMSTREFAVWYNNNLPVKFPRITVKLLQLFRKKHVGMFRKSCEWQADRHRKHLINWLFVRQYAKDCT